MARRRLGLNVGPPLDFSPNSLVLKDVAKSCREWFAQDTGVLTPFDTGDPLTLRASDGYPILDPGKAAATLILREMTDTGSSVPLYPGGTYVLTFRGTGRVSVHFDAAFTETTTGHMEFLVTAGTGGILIKIEESDPTDPVHDLKCFQKKYEGNLGQPFVDEWLDDVAQLAGPIRDMDLGETNFCQLTTFANRCTPEHYTWTLREKGGWPLELRVALANATGRDLWTQVPHGLNAADGAQWVRFLHDRTTGKVVAGKSNEVWNSVFTTDTFTGEQGQYLHYQNLGASQGMGGGDLFLGLIQAYSRDTRQMFEAIEADLGDLSRVVRDVGGWIAEGAGEFFNDQALGFEGLAAKADQLSIAPYPGTSVFDAGKSAATMAQEAYDDVLEVGRWIDLQKAIADSYSVDLGFYEGGHGVESGNTADGPLVTAVHDDPLSERITAELWGEAFYRAGGDPLACAFMAYGRGWAKPFGHKRFPGQDPADAPKWRGLAAFAAGGKGGVRVQNGTVSFGSSGTTDTVTLPVAVDVEKAFVRVTNILSTSHGHTGGQASSTPLRDLSIEVELTDATTLTFTRLGSAAAVDHDIQWAVISYEGPAGGEYEFKVRGVGKATLANGTAEERVDLSGPISQPLRCAAFRTFLSCDSASNPYGAALSTVDVDPATEELVVKRSATSVEVDIGWCVVEFTGSAWAVARYVHEFAAAGGLEALGPMLAADDKTFLFGSQRIQAGQNGLDEVGFLLAPVSGTLFGRVRVGADNVASGGYEVVVFQVAAADLFVQHGGTLLGTPGAGSGNSVYTAPLATALDSKHRAAAFFTADTNAGTAEHPRASWSGQLRVAGAFRADRSYTGEPSDVIYNVVEFPDPDVGELVGESWVQLSSLSTLEGDGALAGSATLDLDGTADLSGPTPTDNPIAGSATLDLAGSATIDSELVGPLAGSIGLDLTGTAAIEAEAELAGSATLDLYAVPPALTDEPELAGTAELELAGTAAIAADVETGGTAGLELDAEGFLLNGTTDDSDTADPFNLGGTSSGTAFEPGSAPAPVPRPELPASEFSPELAAALAEDPNTLSILVDGRQFVGWTRARVRSSMLEAADSFELEVTRGEPWLIRGDTEADVLLGTDVLLRGRVDALNASLGGQGVRVGVAGRSLSSDLIDGSFAGKATDLIGQTLEQVVEYLTAPYDVQVQGAVPDAEPFELFSIQPAESAWAALERACRLRGVLLTSTPAGALELVQPGAYAADVALVEGQNLKAATLQVDRSGRFRTYKIAGVPNAAGFKALINKQKPTAAEAFATDPAIREARRLTLLPEQGVDFTNAQARADWEASYRAAKGAVLQLLTVGWRQHRRGAPWRKNMLVRVSVPSLYVEQVLLIRDVDYSRDEANGQQTLLTCVRPGAFTPNPVVPQEDSPSSGWEGLIGG